jgi:hypothetical protein
MWFDLGYAEGVKVKTIIPNGTAEDLRKFILDFCDQRILCDVHVEQQLLGQVFMPLLFGALLPQAPKTGEEPSAAYSAEQVLQTRFPLGDRPEWVDLVAPKKPAYPAMPEPPQDRKVPDPEQVRILTDDIAAGITPPDQLTVYLELIQLQNVHMDYYHQEALKAWQKTKGRIDRAHRKAMKAYWEQVVSSAQAKEQCRLAQQLWEAQKSCRRSVMEGFMAGLLSDLGVIYEEIRLAGPRGINGYPIFTSMRLLSRSDWDRARPIIQKEMERRSTLEV